MSRMTFTGFMLALVSLLLSPGARPPNSVAATKTNPGGEGDSGTLQKMIVQNGSVSMDLDLNRLNGISDAPQNAVTLQFADADNSLFSILVFITLLRVSDTGAIALVPS